MLMEMENETIRFEAKQIGWKFTVNGKLVR